MINKVIYEILEEIQLKDPEEVDRLKRAFNKRVYKFSSTTYSNVEYDLITKPALYERAMHGLTKELSDSGLVGLEEDRSLETNEIRRVYSLYFLRPLEVENDTEN